MNIHNESLSSANQIIVENSKFIYSVRQLSSSSILPFYYGVVSLTLYSNKLLLLLMLFGWCFIRFLLELLYSVFTYILVFAFLFAVNTVMSTAKRLVLSLRGRKETQTTAGTSSTRLVSATSLSPGHELDEIAVVSGSGDSCHVLSYGSLSQPNGPSYAGQCLRLTF